MTKPVELRKLSVPELEEKVQGLRRQLFVLRVRHSQRQLAKPAQIREARRDLARSMSILGELKRAGGKP